MQINLTSENSSAILSLVVTLSQVKDLRRFGLEAGKENALAILDAIIEEAQSIRNAWASGAIGAESPAQDPPEAS